MNEDKGRMSQMIDFINPFRQVIFYLTVGFILSCFDIEEGYSSTIFSIASVLCFYMGLRMIKKENKAFFVSYVLSIIMLVIVGLIAVMKATFYEIDFLILVYKGVEILLLLGCCIGLGHCVKDKRNIILLAISYLIMKLGIYIMQSDAVIEVIFACMYIAIIFLLKKCEEDLMASRYQVKLSPIKIPAIYMSIIYFVVVMSVTVSAVMASPYTQTDYEYINKVSREYAYPLIHESESKSQGHSNILSDQIERKVYDYDEEHYLFVYHFDWIQFQDEITALNIKTELLENQDILFVNVGNGKQDYKVLEENFVYGDVTMGNADRVPLSYYTYVNPKDHHLDITVGYLALKQQDAEYVNQLTFEFKTSYQYPYDKYKFEYSRGFGHTYVVENGKLIYS